jgi:hypothetical protein
MDSFVLCTPPPKKKNSSVDQIKENKLGGAIVTYGGGEGNAHSDLEGKPEGNITWKQII